MVAVVIIERKNYYNNSRGCWWEQFKKDSK